MVTDIFPGADESFPGGITAFDGKIYFQATDGVHGVELWSSDGTEEGTAMVKDIRTVNSSLPNYFFAFHDKLYFTASDCTNGFELWKTDGTQDGTIKPIASPNTTDPLYYIPFFKIFNDELYFKANYAFYGFEIYKLTEALVGVDGVVSSKFSVYPNSATDKITIQLRDGALTSVSITSITGKKVLESKDATIIDILQLSSGMYIMQIENARNKIFYNKIVKK